MLTRNELFEAVIRALRETQSQSGHDPDVAVSEETVPIGDLCEFDSLNGVEATLALEGQVGHTLPVNLFTADSPRRPLSVGEVVDRLLSMQTAET